MDAAYLADAFGQALGHSRKWAAEQQRSESLFAALLDFHSRLRQLKIVELAAFGIGSDLEDVPSLLRARHVRGVENLMSALRTSSIRFQEHHAAFAEVHASMWERHDSAVAAAVDSHGPSLSRAAFLAEPTWNIVGAGRGLDAQRILLPPVAECIEWLAELDRQYAAELLLKLELLDSIELGSMSADSLHGVAQLWSLQPHISLPALERLRVVVASLTLDPPGPMT